MLRIEKPKGGWIVYGSRAFARCHTHCKFYRVAKKIYKAVKRMEVPETDCKEILVSCMRLTADRGYKERLQERIDRLSD